MGCGQVGLKITGLRDFIYIISRYVDHSVDGYGPRCHDGATGSQGEPLLQVTGHLECRAGLQPPLCCHLGNGRASGQGRPGRSSREGRDPKGQLGEQESTSPWQEQRRALGSVAHMVGNKAEGTGLTCTQPPRQPWRSCTAHVALSGNRERLQANRGRGGQGASWRSWGAASVHAGRTSRGVQRPRTGT